MILFLVKIFSWVILGVATLAALDILFQLAIRRCLGRRIVPFEITMLFFLAAVGGFVTFWGSMMVVKNSDLSILSAWAALCLYLTGVIGYFQCKSIFSRGYSIRVLVDLLTIGRPQSIDQLKQVYGGGLGLSGMLAKRFRSMVTLRLLDFDGREAGPLHGSGRLLAGIGAAYRRLLKLDDAG